ncbi:hypothetical protein ABI59_10285 [Acidobacteria bacterium Mor1]|nr:hypothetical protein ABI59_10285 [Acidobacteria bacterium Mor1]
MRTLGFILCLLVWIGPARAETDPRIELAEEILAQLGVTLEPCGDLPLPLGDDLAGVCGTTRFSKVKSAVAKALAPIGLKHAIEVRPWVKDKDGYSRCSFWLGAATLDVVVHRKTGRIAVLVSRPYPPCGDDRPFLPALSGPPELVEHLEPRFYPLSAARDKIDGTAALAVAMRPGKDPRVICVHHGSPRGFGFELPAIEAVRGWSDNIVSVSQDSDSRDITVVVKYSMADKRKRLGAVNYH